jgi:hypothetical protein
MNAKARKKEKRRQDRLSRSENVNTTAEDAASDAATQSAEEPAPKSFSASMSVDDWKAAAMELMPETFAAVLAQRLEDKGHAPADQVELHTLATMMEQELLPIFEGGVLEMRRRQEGGATIERISMQVGFLIITDDASEGASAQLEGTSSQDGPTAGAADSLRPQDGTDLDSAAKSESLQDEEPNEMWESALMQAKRDGGTDVEIKSKAAKIYRGMKKKLKVKDKKKAKKA